MPPQCLPTASLVGGVPRARHGSRASPPVTTTGCSGPPHQSPVYRARRASRLGPDTSVRCADVPGATSRPVGPAHAPFGPSTP
eukprot:scaffold23969_cov26-Tisochrysis_lutea.AAC.1